METTWTGPFQSSWTAEQLEHGHLLEATEGLDPFAHNSRSIVALGGINIIIERNNTARRISQLDFPLLNRATLHEGSVYMSPSHRKIKIIKPGEGILYDDSFVFAHRPRGEEDSVSKDYVKYIIKDNVSSHRLMNRSLSDTHATRSHCRSTIFSKPTPLTI